MSTHFGGRNLASYFIVIVYEHLLQYFIYAAYQETYAFRYVESPRQTLCIRPLLYVDSIWNVMA